MTFTTSENLIGLAWAGTATSNNKLATMLAWRKMRLFMWLGNPLLQVLRLCWCLAIRDSLRFFRHKELSLP